jgi:hypothetical protein
MNPREAITRQVHALLEREPRINLHRHRVRISNANGVVVLEGEVADVAAKKLALELAASVRGVDGIVDRRRVEPASAAATARSATRSRACCSRSRSCATAGCAPTRTREWKSCAARTPTR